MSSNYEEIRSSNIREYGEGTRHLSFLGRLYTDRTHFIFELLQNAEDANASKILFELKEKALYVMHDGRLFNEQDVKGICGVGLGNKQEDLTQIGRFGIGFKSVYAYTSTPEIHSGSEHFKIEHFVRPFAVEPKNPELPWTTLFNFRLNSDSVKSEIAYNEISSRLSNLNVRTLLFLKNIKEIEFKLGDGTRGVYLREHEKYKFGQKVTVIGENNGEYDEEQWLLFEKPLNLPVEEKNVKVEIGFKFSVDHENQAESLIPIKDSPLVAFFPTEKQTRLGFLIQGPYRTTPSRDNVPKEEEWNEFLIDETSRLIKSSLPKLRELGLLTISLLNALPINTDDFPEENMFYPIVRTVLAELYDSELLPAIDGTYVSAKNAKLARGDSLRELITHNQLSELHESDEELKWLNEEITRDKNPELRSFLINELNINEITPEIFVKKLSKPFLSKQTDDWLIKFYVFLSMRESLWKHDIQSGYRGQSSLLNKPIIRLQDDSHVTPSDDDTPTAYLLRENTANSTFPVVKSSISKNESAYGFLRNIGVPELDLVEEVIVNILPKYENAPLSITTNEHLNDLEKINRAFSTDSKKKKNRLRQRLQETPFLLEERIENEQLKFRIPQQLYMDKDDLIVYFENNDSYAPLYHSYPQMMNNMFKELGVLDYIPVDCKSEYGNEETIGLDEKFGLYRRGLKGFDPDIYVEGLEKAMKNPTIEKSRIIWNQIALKYKHCIRGKVIRASRQDFATSGRICEEEEILSEFGRLLIESSWLPLPDGMMTQPSEISLDDLPDSFEQDERLAELLEMKKNVLAKLAEEAGLSTEDIDLMRQNKTEFQKWKKKIIGRKKKPEFPEKSSTNPDRRKDKSAEKYGESADKKYEDRKRKVRTSRNDIDPGVWLRNSYTNDEEEMICQVCKDEMPFRKLDGQPYFEAVELFAKNFFKKENEALFAAMCPVCAAKYKEFVKKKEDAMLEFKRQIEISDNPEILIQFGEEIENIRFVKTHFIDLKSIIKSIEK